MSAPVSPNPIADSNPFACDPLPVPHPQVELVETDGEPLESEWHVAAINLLIECIDQHFRQRSDYFCGGNMFIYFSEQQARARDYRGPDFFFVWDRPRTPVRPWYAVWDEHGKFPNVIIELLSPSTRKVDLGAKKNLYQSTFRTPDYFCYDPDDRTLLGWSLINGVYAKLEPDERGWLWSEQLGLWVGPMRAEFRRHEETWLRFATPDGKVVETQAEAAERNRDETVSSMNRELAERDAEIARLKAALEQREKLSS